MTKKEEIQLLQLSEHTGSGIKIVPLNGRVAKDSQDNKALLSPHRHDHYCCFFIESGHFDFTVDFHTYRIAASSLLLSAPGQVHEPKAAYKLKGWGLLFDARFVDESARNSIEQSFAKVVLLQLSPEDKDWYAHILRLIAQTDESPAGISFHQQLIHSLINAFFYKTTALAQAQEADRIREYSSRSIHIARQFQQLVREHYLQLKKPAQYATLLHITVSYLNDTVKSVTGFPATWFIQQQVFNEARRLLYYTGKSVKEIAAQLGYEDDKYFIRLFGKATGVSPSAFRKQQKST